MPDRRVQLSRRAKMTRFGVNPVASTVSIPPRRQPRHDTSTRNRRDFKLNVSDPDLLIPIKQTRVNKRHSDPREPQPSSSDSQPASSQPVSETTTSESSVSLPSSPSGSSSTESTSTSGLMNTGTRYANIERECLAIVFACQKFSTYLLGRSFVAESDHKPLEMIAMKNLANAPPHLQRMLLQLQRYDVTIKYRPGKEMQLADALSRCPARASEEIKLDMRVDFIAFMKPWIEKLKDSTQRGPILVTEYQLTQQGWPHQRRHVPHLARRYWDFRDELSTDDGMLLKGPRLIIPGELQEEYLSRLHEGHLSASKVQENAKQHMYWTGIDADIEDYTKRCMYFDRLF